MTQIHASSAFIGLALQGLDARAVQERAPACRVCHGAGRILLRLPHPDNPFRGMTVETACHQCGDEDE